LARNLGNPSLIGSRTYTLTVPIPPSANVIWRNNYRRRQTYLHPAYRKWLDDCALISKSIYPRDGTRWDVEIKFFIYYVNKIGRMDCDNRIKPLVDFLKGLIGIDDRFLRRGSWERVDVQAPKLRRDHYCEVTIKIY